MSDTNRQIVPCPITEVTVLEDRATVRRTGVLSFGPGRHRLRIEEVAPVLADKTLVARATTDGAQVRDASVQRRRVLLTKDKREVLQSLEMEHEKLTEELARAEEARARRALEIDDLQRAAMLSSSECSEDVAWGKDVADAWSNALDGLGERQREVREALGLAAAEDEERTRKFERLNARIAELLDGRDVLRADLDLDVTVEGAEEREVTIVVDYLVPNACWRPSHRAELRGEQLLFMTEATIWQRTGEDWLDARVFVSTERPSLGVEPPALVSDVLRVQGKARVVEVEGREQQIHTTGLGAEARAIAEVPGVDDGGETLRLPCEGSASIPSDGHPYRQPLQRFETDVERTLRVAPELVPAAVIVTTQAHRGATPILAGPVELWRDSGPVGRGRVEFVAPGERFELGWGPELAVRVRREAERLDDKARVLSSWIRTPHRVTVTLSNLERETRVLEVVERVPVSEIEQVRIEMDSDETTGGRRPDEDGFLRWAVQLGPLERETIRLGYTLAKRDTVVGV